MCGVQAHLAAPLPCVLLQTSGPATCQSATASERHRSLPFGLPFGVACCLKDCELSAGLQLLREKSA